jgi:hypothetical protein
MKYSICIEGEAEPMANVTGSFSLVVNPGQVGSTLAITTNPNVSSDTEGVADPGQIVAKVTGGTAPYNFSATGLPNGLNLAQQPDADGVSVDVVMSGTPAVGDATLSPYTIAITVTDSATPTPAMARANVNVQRPMPGPGRRF